jgi:hypothetical protein
MKNFYVNVKITKLTMNIQDYSEKAIVVRIPLLAPLEQELINSNGKYNPNLNGGAGWIFSKKQKANVEKIRFKIDLKLCTKEQIEDIKKQLEEMKEQ